MLNAQVRDSLPKFEIFFADQMQPESGEHATRKICATRTIGQGHGTPEKAHTLPRLPLIWGVLRLSRQGEIGVSHTSIGETVPVSASVVVSTAPPSTRKQTVSVCS